MANKKILIDLDVNGDITGDSFIKDGGASTEFLKADGSVDTSTYLTSTDIDNLVDGSGTTNYVTKWTGADTISNSNIFDNGTNVGIGTDSPSEKLGVFGNIRLENGAQRNIIGPANENLGIFANPNGADEGILFSTDNGTTTEMIILNGGNVGIGNTNPARPLSVHRSSAGSLANFLHYTDASNFSGLYITASNTDELVTLTASGDTSASFAFKTGTNERMRIASTGNVGIGTDSPSQKLEVNGNVKVTEGNLTLSKEVNPYLYLNDTNGGAAIFQQSGNDTRIGSDSNTQVQIVQNNAVAITIDTSKNVGIGTSSPTTNLDVRGGAIIAGSTPSAPIGTSSTLEVYENGEDATLAIHQDNASSTTKFAQIRLRNGGNDTYIKTPTSGQGLIVDTESVANAFVIDIDGNVGIGTTSPDAKLDIEGNFEGAYALKFTNTQGTGNVSGFRSHGVNGESLSLYNESTLIQRWDEDGDSSFTGNVGIGTTNPSQKLEVAGNIQATGTKSISSLFDANHYMRIESNSSGGILKGTDGGVITTLVRTYGDSYFNGGNVGIGTTSPGQKLDVNGSINVSSNVFAEGFYGDRLWNTDNSTLRFGTNNTERARITSDGNVGIGTTDPKSKLDIDGGVKIGDDTDTASADKVGTMRYRTGTDYVEVDGVELVTNGDFSNGSANWGNYITGSSTVVFTDVATLNVDASNSNVGIYQENVFASGKQYKVVVRMKASSSFDAEVLETQGASTMSTIGSVSLTTSYQDFTFYFTGTGSNDIFIHRKFSASSANQSITIDNVSIKEVLSLDVPRLDYSDSSCPSLLLEGQSTNLIEYSEDFSDSYWTKIGTTVTSGFTSPDGANNAYKMTDDATDSKHGVYYIDVLSQDGNVYTRSVFVKKGTARYVVLSARHLSTSSGTSWIYDFDINDWVLTGSTGVGQSIEDYGNGWIRLSISHISNSNFNNDFSIGISSGDTISDTTYSGNGDTIYIWGAQVEAGSYATSYIPTNGTTATRLADVCTSAGNASTFNDSEGVLYVNTAALYNDGTSRQISISAGNTTERVYFGFRANSNEFILSSRDSSYLITTISDVKNYNKYSFQYKSGNFKAFVNGFNYALTVDGGLLPTGLNTLNFDAGSGTQDFYGKTKEIAYYDTALTDSELEELTSWESFIQMANALQYTIK